MPFHQVGAIKYFQFSTLEGMGLYQAVFTRRGGISPTPWHSLNFGASVGDSPSRVTQNRESALSALQIKSDSVYDLYQVHSTRIIVTDQPLSAGEQHQKADAILTNRPFVTLMMRFADCVPILLFDPIHRAIGIAHAGWIGTVDKIAGKTVMRMVEEYGTNPVDVRAAIGPSIGPDHYSVGKDVVDRVRQSFGEKADELINLNRGRAYFDLWKANQLILAEVGVQQVEVCGLCTCCNLGDWYSHRGEHGKTGRFGVVFGLGDKGWLE